MNRKEFLTWVVSVFMLFLLAGLIAYLTYIPVPDKNKDIIITVIGVLLGGASAAMPNLFGSPDGEAKQLRSRIDELESANKVLNAELITIKHQYDSIVAMLVQRHVVQGEGIVTS